MWTCSKCRAGVEADFDACWRSGTTSEGVEDPDFVTADEAPPIVEPTDYLRLDAGKPPIDGDLPEPPLDLVACFHSKSPFEAKILAEELGDAGIPWTIENTWRLNGAT